MIGCQRRRIMPGGFTATKRKPAGAGFYREQGEIKSAAEAALRRVRWTTKLCRG